jgi:16S rRNA processing protein RimM
LDAACGGAFLLFRRTKLASLDGSTGRSQIPSESCPPLADSNCGVTELLEVGRIVKAHGIRGEVIVDLISNLPAERLAAGARLDSDRGELEVLTATPHQGRWIVAFRGIEDRNRAETFRGTILRAAPIEGDEDTLWVHELIGSEVVDTAGRSYGPVNAVEANPASDLLVLAGDKLVPLVFVVSKMPGRVVIDPPAGLLDDDD